MKFFEARRPQVYFDGGRLSLDKKTGKQMWKWKLVIDLAGEDAAACDDVILNNFVAIETRENLVEEMILTAEVPRQQLEFFGLEDHTAPLLCLFADIIGLRLTREDDITQLHFEVEFFNTPVAHDFVRDHFFTRLWAEFRDQQRPLLDGQHPARQAQKERQNKRVN